MHLLYCRNVVPVLGRLDRWAFRMGVSATRQRRTQGPIAKGVTGRHAAITCMGHTDPKVRRGHSHALG
jgi:hypothetical protein